MSARVPHLDDRRPDQRRRDDQVFDAVNEVRADLSKPAPSTAKQRNNRR